MCRRWCGISSTTHGSSCGANDRAGVDLVAARVGSAAAAAGAASAGAPAAAAGAASARAPAAAARAAAAGAPTAAARAASAGAPTAAARAAPAGAAAAAAGAAPAGAAAAAPGATAAGAAASAATSRVGSAAAAHGRVRRGARLFRFLDGRQVARADALPAGLGHAGEVGRAVSGLLAGSALTAQGRRRAAGRGQRDRTGERCKDEPKRREPDAAHPLKLTAKRQLRERG
jgi:hypothetical protein